MWMCSTVLFCFFFNDTATTEIYTLSLHDALPISASARRRTCASTSTGSPACHRRRTGRCSAAARRSAERDRKSTRLNYSHANISYAVFCLKKKNNTNLIQLLISILYTVNLTSAYI